MKRNPNYHIREVLGRMVAMPEGMDVIASDQLVELNATAAFLLEALGQEMDFDTLLSKMAERFDAQPSDLPQLEADLREFLQAAKQADLIGGEAS